VAHREATRPVAGEIAPGMPMATIPFCSSAVLISHKRSPAAYRALREARCEFAAQIAHAATLRLKAHQVGSSKAATRPYVGGFQSGIDGLSSWLMRIIKEVGHGAALQAVWE
jgi:hypothetical protein